MALAVITLGSELRPICLMEIVTVSVTDAIGAAKIGSALEADPIFAVAICPASETGAMFTAKIVLVSEPRPIFLVLVTYFR